MLEFCSLQIAERLAQLTPASWNGPIWVLHYLNNSRRLCQYGSITVAVDKYARVWRCDGRLTEIILPGGFRAKSCSINDKYVGIVTRCGKLYTVRHGTKKAVFFRYGVIKIEMSHEWLGLLDDRQEFTLYPDFPKSTACWEAHQFPKNVIDIGNEGRYGCVYLTVDRTIRYIRNYPFGGSCYPHGAVGLYSQSQKVRFLYENGSSGQLQPNPITGIHPNRGIIASSRDYWMDEAGNVLDMERRVVIRGDKPHKLSYMTD